METIQRAIIVAAGEGTRLRPVTLKTPKPLVKVNGKRIIDTIIDGLKVNGIHEIYIIIGYKKEQFEELYQNDPDIHLIENTHYLEGNNITSLYAANQYIPGSFIIEGDLFIKDNSIFYPETELSSYCASWAEDTDEWALEVENGIVQSCSSTGGRNTFRLWGVSMWTKEDGALLASCIRHQYEEVKDWTVYWDNVPLFLYKDQFRIGIRETPAASLLEIDTFKELTQIDSSYLNLNN